MCVYKHVHIYSHTSFRWYTFYLFSHLNNKNVLRLLLKLYKSQSVTCYKSDIQKSNDSKRLKLLRRIRHFFARVFELDAIEEKFRLKDEQIEVYFLRISEKSCFTSSLKAIVRCDEL